MFFILYFWKTYLIWWLLLLSGLTCLNVDSYNCVWMLWNFTVLGVLLGGNDLLLLLEILGILRSLFWSEYLKAICDPIRIFRTDMYFPLSHSACLFGYCTLFQNICHFRNQESINYFFSSITSFMGIFLNTWMNSQIHSYLLNKIRFWTKSFFLLS